MCSKTKFYVQIREHDVFGIKTEYFSIRKAVYKDITTPSSKYQPAFDLTYEDIF